MTENQPPNPQDIQFDKAVPQGGGPSACMNCKTPLANQYFSLNKQIVCPNCKTVIEQSFQGGSAASRVLKALFWGIPAGILGAGIYYGIRAATGYEFGLISILIGYAVGFGVRKGSGFRGGLPYQIIAVLITYIAICSTWVPYIITGMVNAQHAEATSDKIISSSTPSPQPGQDLKTDTQNTAQTSTTLSTKKEVPVTLIWYVAAAVISLGIPFMLGFSNILGILIIGFGVYQAWQMNKKVKLVFEGPFDLKK